MYEYMANIKYTDQDLLLCFVEEIAGDECKSKDIFRWIEKLEKVMLDYEN